MRARDAILKVLASSPPITGVGDRTMTYRGLSLSIGRTVSTTFVAVRELKSEGLVVDDVCACCGGPVGPRLTARGLDVAIGLDSVSNVKRRTE